MVSDKAGPERVKINISKYNFFLKILIPLFSVKKIGNSRKNPNVSYIINQ